MLNRRIYNEKRDRRSSREQWMEELSRINFNKNINSKYETSEDDYSEESYP